MSDTSAPRDTNDSVYQPGQEWSYKNRSGEEGATFYVCKVASHPKIGNIIHVTLRGLNIRNPIQKTGFSDVITHLPFTEQAIDNSINKVITKSAKLPEDLQEDFTMAYADWRNAFVEGKATVLNETIADTLDYIESTINSDPGT